MTSNVSLLRIMSCIGLLSMALLSDHAMAQPCIASFDYGGEDTVCINTMILLTDLSTSPNGVGGWAWSANGGQLPGLDGTSSFTPANEGIYEIVLEIFDLQSACSDQDTVTIVVLGNPGPEIDVIDISCHGLCDGKASVFYSSPNSEAYTATWTIGGTGTLTSLCAGVYVANISDDLGCTSAGTSVLGEVIEPPELLSNISNGPVVLGCTGDAGILLNVVPSGGIPNVNGAYNVLWSPALGISDVFQMSPLLTPGIGNTFQIYTATITDDRGCTTSSNVQLLPRASMVEGIITIGGSPCSDCEVALFQPQSNEWQRLFTGATDASGHYLFGTVPGQIDFRLMADPDDAVHPNVLQGFYAVAQSTYLWEQSTSLNSGCGVSWQRDIDLPEAIEHNGQCTLRGTLYQVVPGKTQTEEDPIPLIDVVVEKTPPGSPQSKATTDANGEFEFNFMESSDTLYTLYVNIPGLPMNQTHQILIGQSDLLHDQLDLCVNLEGTFISTCTALGIEELTGDVPALSIYPNPNSGGFLMLMGSFEGERTHVSIVDVSGRTVLEHSFENTPRDFQFSGLSEGYYLLRINDGKRAESLPVCVLNH